MRIAVISDIHGAALPFAQALKDSRHEGYDQLILLGDLLTYGMEPQACLDLARNAIAREGAILIGGNHDQLYVDLDQGQSAYADAMPEWIRESVFWTMQQIGRWPADIGWEKDWLFEDALFAHANPFGYGDWTYLSDDCALERAADELSRKGLRWGFFGHLHRPLQYKTATACVNVLGSIGQPRSREHPHPQWSMIELIQGEISIESHDVNFAPAAHCAVIQQTAELTQATRNMLCRYFR